MKKTLTCLLAACIAASVGTAAFAQAIPQALIPAGQPALAEQPAAVQTDASVTPLGDPTGLAFGADQNQSNAVLGETILEPGIEYRFPVSMVFGDQAVPLTDEMMKGMRFLYSKISSTAVKTFKIEEYKGTYYLFVALKEATPNEVLDIKYNIKYVRKDNQLSVFSHEVKFQFGYNEFSDVVLNQLERGDEIEIRSTNPVITADQFERIARINDYKNVNLVGPSWSYEINITDEPTKNLLSNNKGVKEVISQYPDQDFRFYNFPGRPVFMVAGKVSLDVADLMEEFGSLHAYRYANGEIYALKTTYNSDTETLEFRTNTLDCFFVTNREIKRG